MRREIEIALSEEKRLGENLLIPIVLECSAVAAMDYCDLRDRKYLTCYDFSEDSIESVARQLVSSVLEKSSARIEALTQRLASKSARAVADHLPDLIRAIIFPYRAVNPLTIESFRHLLRDKGHAVGSQEELLDELEGLRSSGKMLGIYFDEDEIYLCLENVADKRQLNPDEKKRIARFASKLVLKGQSIAVDCGSTTLSLVDQLCRRFPAAPLIGCRYSPILCLPQTGCWKP